MALALGIGPAEAASVAIRQPNLLKGRRAAALQSNVRELTRLLEPAGAPT